MEKIAILRKKALKLPLLPGVYIMKNKNAKVIYIGKAKLLKNRVSGYFTNLSAHPVKVLRMVEQVDDFDFIITKTEVEALVLECSLIKQYKPKYNILLKDDKGYSYIKISPPPYSRITAEKQKDKDGEYLGPFMSFYSAREASEAANHSFLLPTCKRVFPRDFKKERPCLNFHIGLCSGVCRGNESPLEYEKRLREAVSFIKKGEKETISVLEKQMAECSQNLQFEKAAELRDRIKAIKRISERQTVRTKGVRSKDFIGFVSHENGVLAEVLGFRNGSLVNKSEYNLNGADEGGELISGFIEAFYGEREIPEFIVLSQPPADKEVLEEFLTEKRGKRVKIITNLSDDNKRIMALCLSNAAEKIAHKGSLSGEKALMLSELTELLGLSKPPKYIESADISHLSADNTVGVLVVFKDGAPYKKAYKRFNLDEFTKPDDTESLKTVFRRRFARYLSKEETDEGFKTLPDLILLDGGKGQVNAVKGVLSEMGISVPVFGIVKDENHRTRELTDGKGSIAIKRTHYCYKLCALIGEEVHRFAITSFRKKKTKSTLKLALTEIEGVGVKTAEKILKKYKGLAPLKTLTPKELSKGVSIPLKTAENIIKFVLKY